MVSGAVSLVMSVVNRCRTTRPMRLHQLPETDAASLLHHEHQVIPINSHPIMREDKDSKRIQPDRFHSLLIADEKRSEAVLTDLKHSSGIITTTLRSRGKKVAITAAVLELIGGVLMARAWKEDSAYGGLWLSMFALGGGLDVLSFIFLHGPTQALLSKSEERRVFLEKAAEYKIIPSEAVNRHSIDDIDHVYDVVYSGLVSRANQQEENRRAIQQDVKIVDRNQAINTHIQWLFNTFIPIPFELVIIILQYNGTYQFNLRLEESMVSRFFKDIVAASDVPHDGFFNRNRNKTSQVPHGDRQDSSLSSSISRLVLDYAGDTDPDQKSEKRATLAFTG